MSRDNKQDGYNLYKGGDQKDLDWFHKQWKRWPKRVDENKTTNLSFMYGGILAYRELHDKEPDISKDLQGSIKFLDRSPKG